MSSISNITKSTEDNIFSVSQVSALIQNTISNKFGNVTIKGEISGYKLAPSGHAYFNLKDDGAVLNAVCWKGAISKIPFKMEDGLEVIATGNISTYPNKSNYQIVCNSIRADGAGALMALLEERKKKLAAEGLFDVARKKKLPFMPKTIGVITSPTGAVIRDILHRISDRFGVHVLVYPVAVQGEGAAEQIAGAIEYFNSIPHASLREGEADEAIQFSGSPRSQNSLAMTPVRPDVLIVARGGGSVEDLWCFNEEIVVRASANSQIPLISAVGHETDTTLIDYASDVRAPTPTAAAEIAVPVKAEIIARILEIKNRNYNAINRIINNLERYLKASAASLISPKQMLVNMAQRLDDISERLNGNIGFLIRSKESELKSVSANYPLLANNIIKFNSQKIENYKKLLESYNYKNVMKRGYSLVSLANGGDLVKSATQLNSGDAISIQFYDGETLATIGGSSSSNSPSEITSKPASVKAKKPKSKPQKEDSDKPQGSLF